MARGLAFGACRLPNDAGLIFKVLGPRNRAGKGQGARVLGHRAQGGHRRRPPSALSLALRRATDSAGSHRPTRLSTFVEATMEKLLAKWERLCASSGLLRFVDINLRGVGQVMFQNNPLTGALFLAAIGWGSYAAGAPRVAIAGLLAVVVCNADGAMAARRRSTRFAPGSMATTASLSDLRWRHFWRRARCMWVYVVLGAAVSVVVMLGTVNAVKPWGVCPHVSIRAHNLASSVGHVRIFRARRRCAALRQRCHRLPALRRQVRSISSILSRGCS